MFACQTRWRCIPKNVKTLFFKQSDEPNIYFVAFAEMYAFIKQNPTDVGHVRLQKHTMTWTRNYGNISSEAINYF